ncbi:MAG: AAA family ATPase, partial [Exiguobacterium sp.]|nr:AAA family ATPase [Exiguobacterium sp.]
NSDVFRGKKPKITYDLPQTVCHEPTQQIYDYFTTRGISKSTVDDFKIASDDNGNIVFRFFLNGEDVFEKFRRPETFIKENGKQKEWRVPNTMAILFHMDDCVFSKPLVITEGQCFPGDAEILTPNGWQRLDMYDGQTTVCQVDENFKASFVAPTALIKKDYDGNLIAVSIGGNYSSVTTPDHNIVLMNHRSGTVKKRQAKDVKHSTAELIPTTAMLDGPGIPLKNIEIALYLAVCADGTIDVRKNGVRYCRFTVQKQRKYDRMKSILDGLNISYCESCDKTGRRHFFGFHVPEYIRDKHIPSEWIWQATLDQRLFILHEIVHWDGNHVVNRNQTEFSTRFEEDAIVVQTLAHTAGFMSTVMRRKQKYRYLGEERFGIVYKTSLLWSKHHVSVQAWHPTEEAYKGIVYCVSVPSGMIMVRQNGHITVTGNCDAMALYEAGIKNVVSVPSGCEDLAWIDLCWDWLEKFNSIILFGDDDEPGRKMVREVARRLDESRCMIVENYPARPNSKITCKDANEILVRFGEMKLIQMVEEARAVPVRGLLNLADVTPYDPTMVPRIKTGIPSIDEVTGGLLEGGITAIVGRAGSGKSCLVSLLMLNAIEQGYTVCAYSGELRATRFQEWFNLAAAGSDWIGLKYDPIKDKQVPIVPQKVAERIMRWYNNKLFLFDNNETFVKNQADAIVQVFTTAIRRHGAKLLVIDNLMTSVSDRDDEWKAQALFANQLKQLANRFGVAVVMVCHARKTKVGEKLRADDLSGSSAVNNLADLTISVEPSKLSIIKNRDTGILKTIEFCYCPDSKRIYEASKGDNLNLSWDKEGLASPDVNADTLPEYQVVYPIAEPF